MRCFFCPGTADTQLCSCPFKLCEDCAVELVVVSKTGLLWPCPDCNKVTILPESNVLSRTRSRRLLERQTDMAFPKLTARARRDEKSSPPPG